MRRLAVFFLLGVTACSSGVRDEGAVLVVRAPLSSVIVTTTTFIIVPQPVQLTSTSTTIPNYGNPVGLIVESDNMNIDAPVGSYGSNDGTMEIPSDAGEVGWYKNGASPGEVGSAVLAAHVSIKSQGRGVFYDLKDLNLEDRVTVLYDDGSELEFEVVGNQTYLKTELPYEDIFSSDGSPRLTLVTCGGEFDSSESSFDSNVVVTAVPVS